MKTNYVIPATKVIQVNTNYNMMQSISGPSGLKDGGQAPDTSGPYIPQ